MGDRTPIIVATIGLIGTITVGLLANADKLSAMFGRPEGHDDAGRRAVAPPPGNMMAVQTGREDAAHAGSREETPAGAGKDASDRLVTPPTGSARIDGLWTSSDGYRFSFSQNGSSFRYTATQEGSDKGTGKGTIDGDALRYSFTSPDGDGACTATLAKDRDSIAGSCHMNDQASKTWPFEITRFVR